MKRKILRSTPIQYSGVVLKAVFDGDVNTKMKDIQYSTLIRSMFTVGDMEKLYEMEEGKMKLKMSSVYGKLGEVQ